MAHRLLDRHSKVDELAVCAGGEVLIVGVDGSPPSWMAAAVGAAGQPVH